ncbi:HAD family hydrolase, partial [Mycoplasmopsis bovis]|uniref:HAD family hydrolase n=1 Tax=Mycoplasmopsis bovis TaxID=28903 RepID=UPI003D2E45E7
MLDENLTKPNVIIPKIGITATKTWNTSTKGFAEVTYAKARGVSPEECVHIGDTLNDATCASHVG